MPACDDCNTASAPTDEEFKVGISLLAGVETPETRKLWNEGALRTLGHNKRMLRDVESRIVDVDVHSRAGIYLGKQRAVLVPAAPIHDVLIRTVRGLYYHHYGESLGKLARCAVQRMKPGRVSDAPLLDFISRLPVVNIAGGAFKYRYTRADEEPLASFWLMQFHGAETVFGYSKRADDPWEPGGPPMAKDRWCTS